MTDIEIGHENRQMVNAIVVIHAVAVGDIRLAAEDV